jgi:hypothetical protein
MENTQTPGIPRPNAPEMTAENIALAYTTAPTEKFHRPICIPNERLIASSNGTTEVLSIDKRLANEAYLPFVRVEKIIQTATGKKNALHRLRIFVLTFISNSLRNIIV